MSLKRYLELAYKEAQLTTDAALGSVQQITGTLARDSNNLVLVYGGSFNPPHRGHVDVLFSLLRPEVAAVAVVVLPSEDFHLRHKVAHRYPGFFLRQDRKVAIWEAMPLLPRERVWVWGSTWYPFKPFAEALVRLAAADGFRLTLTHVIGPDNLVPTDALSMEIPCALPNVLVTNRARYNATHFLPEGRPRRWDGFGEWHRHDACGCATGDTKPAEREVVLWRCTGTRSDGTETRGYYLQFKTPAKVEMNSTDFRRVWMQSPPLDETSLNQLSAEALLALLAPVLQDQYGRSTNDHLAGSHASRRLEMQGASGCRVLGHGDEGLEDR